MDKETYDLLHNLVGSKDVDSIREQYLGVQSLNSFVNGNSGSRVTMMTQHLSQLIVPLNGEEKIVQSGLDHQLGATTFSVRIEKDCEVIGVVSRYRNLIENDEDIPEILIFVRNFEDGEFDYYSIPKYHLLHQYFGFEYVQNREELERMVIGKRLDAGTILADSPCVKKNSGYGIGINTRIGLLSLPETAEDGIIISESLANKFAYNIYEVRTIKFGSDKFLLNTYGTDDEYKGFPGLGENINSDSILAALRPHNNSLVPSLTSVKDLQNFDNNFDETIYLRGPGGKIKIGDKTYDDGVVVDVKCWYNPKAKAHNNVYPKTLEAVNKYANALRNFYKDIWYLYDRHIKTSGRLYGDNQIKISPKLSRLIQDALVLGDIENKKITLSHKSIPLDVYTMEFVIKYTCPLKKGSKLSCLNGGKGVVVSILPDDLMPKDSDGKPLEIVMDPVSNVSRMNMGRLTEIYIGSSSREARRLILEQLDLGNKEEAWNLLMEFISIFETEQVDYYSNTTPSEKEEIFKEIRESELFIFYRVSSKKPSILIVNDISKSKFKPRKEQLTVVNANGTICKTKKPALVGILYNILLSKTPDDNLSVTSNPWVNHYGFPTSPSVTKKYGEPHKNSAVRILGETEVRLFLCYGGAMLLAELKDRANNPKTFKNIYENLLKINTPGFSENIVTREEAEFGLDTALVLYKTILNTAGYDLEYEEDPESQYTKEADPRTGINKK